MNDEVNDTDKRILEALQHNSAATIQQIAAQVGLSASTVHDRIRKLDGRLRQDKSDRDGSQPVILGYEARLDATRLGLGLLAFVFVRADERVGAGDAGRCLAQIPEVQEVHHIAGEDCYLVKLRTADTASLGRLLREQFAAIPAIHSTRTTIVLETLKETAHLPIRFNASPDQPPESLETAPPTSGVTHRETAATRRGPHTATSARGARRIPAHSRNTARKSE